MFVPLSIAHDRGQRGLALVEGVAHLLERLLLQLPDPLAGNAMASPACTRLPSTISSSRVSGGVVPISS